MTDLTPIRRALISVSDKTGLIDLGKALSERGVELLSTGGSAKALRDAGLHSFRFPTLGKVLTCRSNLATCDKPPCSWDL